MPHYPSLGSVSQHPAGFMRSYLTLRGPVAYVSWHNWLVEQRTLLALTRYNSLFTYLAVKGS